MKELEEISRICHEHHLSLYLDGARLAYALACSQNDVFLPDLARLCDAFYIGGTKCGAMFGEAVVFPKHNFVPRFFTMIKQQGALLAKGRMLGIQFDVLFTDNLYNNIGRNAIEAADQIRGILEKQGYPIAFQSPTNQIFLILTKSQLKTISEKVELDFWENIDEDHMIMRIATSWATQPEEVKMPEEVLRS